MIFRDHVDASPERWQMAVECDRCGRVHSVNVKEHGGYGFTCGGQQMLGSIDWRRVADEIADGELKRRALECAEVSDRHVADMKAKYPDSFLWGETCSPEL